MIKDKTVGKLLNVDVKTLRNEFKIQEDESFAWVTMECGKEFAHGMFVSDLLFGKWFKEHAPSKELEETTIKLDELFTKVGLVSSKSDFRRILKNNALTADEEKLNKDDLSRSIKFTTDIETWCSHLPENAPIPGRLERTMDFVVLGNGKLKWSFVVMKPQQKSFIKRFINKVRMKWKCGKFWFLPLKEKLVNQLKPSSTKDGMIK